MFYSFRITFFFVMTLNCPSCLIPKPESRFFNALLPVTCRIAPIVKERNVMNSNNKSDHRVHMAVGVT